MLLSQDSSINRQCMVVSATFRDKDHRENLKLVELLLKNQRDFSVNPTTGSGLSHLHIACACNNHGMVMDFLNHGADVNHRIYFFCQPYGGDKPLMTLLFTKVMKLSMSYSNIELMYILPIVIIRLRFTLLLRLALKIRTL